MNKLRNQSIIS